MNKSNNIINIWSNIKKESLITHITDLYSKNNNLNLKNLEKLNEIKNFYWYICNKSNELFLFQIINDELNINNINVEQFLTKINRFYYKQIDIYINQFNKRLIKKTKDIIKFNKYYIINNIKTTTIRKINYISNNNDQPLKKRRIDSMVTASSIRNYMLNDTLSDYIKEFNILSINDTPTIKKYIDNNSISENKSTDNKINDNLFTSSILKAGIDFETELINILLKNHKIVTVALNYTHINKLKFNETIDLMKKGIPIIYQGVLYNDDNNTFGSPDLLVRSDYINKLMNYNVLTDEECVIPSPNLNINFHYKVIDIKHSIINLKTDMIHINNNGSVPAFKGQLYIYTHALNKVLGININKAFIWGKKYDYYLKNTKHEINNFLSKLGTINYDTVDIEYITLTNNAIEWIKILKYDGMNWKLLPKPSCYELYPNMKNIKNINVLKIKNDLAENINEITGIWNCGIKQREYAYFKNIYGWNNELCTSTNLGFNNVDTKTFKIIDKILNINRQDVDLIRPNKINYDRDQWTDNSYFEFYIDFETLTNGFESSINEGVVNNNSDQYIFMIGVGYKLNNKWVFKNFIMENKTHFSELNMIKSFINYINDILKKNNKTKCKLYHWSSAEPNFLNKFKKKHNIKNLFNDNIIFYDLYNVFIEEPIVIKDVFNFSLKTISKQLYKHKLINSTWNNNSSCSDGLNALILANNLYNNNINIINNPIMNDIAEYNEIDCKVMFEIHNLIKNL